ncbi:MAG: cobyrinate a,c-diamide synthase [Candidatus Tectimicrobiota bacterium]
MTPCLTVAGTHSGVGKTLMASGLAAAFRAQGLRVQTFKVGPDFIDPTFLALASGRPCRTLDSWMLPRPVLLHEYIFHAEQADLAIIEGVMGLFDGLGGADEAGSTAQVAKWCASPVVLVVDAWAMARSAGALVLGYERFDPELALAGVVFNRVAGPSHLSALTEAVAGRCQAAVVGALAQNEALAIPERHLGLVLAEEQPFGEGFVAELVARIQEGLDLERIAEIASRAGPVGPAEGPAVRPVARGVTVAVARDEAFAFYYPTNLELLEAAGAQMVDFSPLKDAALPEGTRAVYLGGGYPELYAERLSANAAMRAEIKAFAASGGPIYAECGGFMYLSHAIVDLDGRAHPMVGIFPTRTRMLPTLRALGYREVVASADSPVLVAGQRARGHEFHYSEMEPMPQGVERAYRIEGAAHSADEGYRIGSVVASYIHLHFASQPETAVNLVRAALRFQP